MPSEHSTQSTREPWHGTRRGYTHHGCRCEECVAVNRAYKDAYKARERAEIDRSRQVPPSKPPTGRPLDVLAFITRAMDRPPLLIDLAARRFDVKTQRAMQAELRYVKERLAELAAEETMLSDILRFKAQL